MRIVKVNGNSLQMQKAVLEIAGNDDRQIIFESFLRTDGMKRPLEARVVANSSGV